MGDRDLLGFIVYLMEERGYPPSITELAEEFNVGRATIQRDLVLLEESGKIARTPGVARGITILETE